MKRLLTRAAPLLVAALMACGGEHAAHPPAAADTTTTDASQAAPVARLNLNTATEAELRTIPDVGDRMVHEFFEYRPYVSIQQFRREIGKYVSREQVAAYEAYVFVPIDANESDAATLQQLPGVSANEAAELIARRPYETRAAFLERLATVVGPNELQAAEAYLEAP